MILVAEESSKPSGTELDDGPRSGPWPYPDQCGASLFPPQLGHGFACTRPHWHRGDHIDGPQESAFHWTDETPHSRPHRPRELS